MEVGSSFRTTVKVANLVVAASAETIRLEIIEDNRLTARGKCQNSEAENENDFFHTISF